MWGVVIFEGDGEKRAIQCTGLEKHAGANEFEIGKGFTYLLRMMTIDHIKGLTVIKGQLADVLSGHDELTYPHGKGFAQVQYTWLSGRNVIRGA